MKFYPHNGSEYWQVVNKTKVTTDPQMKRYWCWIRRPRRCWPCARMACHTTTSIAWASEDYHRLLWSVEDGCGNLNTCEYLLRLEDCKQPSPVCVGLSSVVMPGSGEVTIWAVDFNASSFDDCTAAKDLLYSFSGTSYQPSRSFDCEALVENGSPSFIVEIWAADEGNDQDCNGVITRDERKKTSARHLS